MSERYDPDVTYLLRILRTVVVVAAVALTVSFVVDLWHHEWWGAVLDGVVGLAFSSMGYDVHGRVKARR